MIANAKAEFDLQRTAIEQTQAVVKEMVAKVTEEAQNMKQTTQANSLQYSKHFNG